MNVAGRKKKAQFGELVDSGRGERKHCHCIIGLHHHFHMTTVERKLRHGANGILSLARIESRLILSLLVPSSCHFSGIVAAGWNRRGVIIIELLKYGNIAIGPLILVICSFLTFHHLYFKRGRLFILRFSAPSLNLYNTLSLSYSQVSSSVPSIQPSSF